MESAYTLANKELQQIRETNRQEQRRRLEQVRAAAPEYTRVESALAHCSAALARCVMEGGAGLNAVSQMRQKAMEDKAEILRRLQLPPDYLDDLYSCPLCRDTGFDENGHRCSCLKQLILKNMGATSNMTEYMKEQTFERFDFNLFASQPPSGGRDVLEHIRRLRARAEQFADLFDVTHQNLLLLGNSGTGKTYLSSCIANRALARGKSVYYQTAFKLFDMLEKLKFGRLNGDEAEHAGYISQYVYQADLLIIDDLGTEFITQYSSAALFDILNTRLLEEKSTILSSNLNLERLEAVYSSRLKSRLAGSYDILPFLGKDLRMGKFERRN